MEEQLGEFIAKIIVTVFALLLFPGSLIFYLLNSWSRDKKGDDEDKEEDGG